MKCKKYDSEDVTVSVINEVHMKDKHHGVIWWWWRIPDTSYTSVCNLRA